MTYIIMKMFFKKAIRILLSKSNELAALIWPKIHNCFIQKKFVYPLGGFLNSYIANYCSELLY